MEKRAIVEPGRTPSEISGRPSDMIKEGHAICSDEAVPAERDEKRLAQQLQTLYNSGRDVREQ